MLTDEELETLATLKKKAKFENSLRKNIKNSRFRVSSDLSSGKIRGKIKQMIKEFFFHPKGYWIVKKKLTEEEFELAWKRETEDFLEKRKRARFYR